MHPVGFFALAAVVLAGSAEAQETPGGCAGLAADSFEAAVLGCDEATDRAVPPRTVNVLEEAPPPGVSPVASLDQAEGDGLAPGSGGEATLRVVRGPEEVPVLPGAATAVTALAAGADSETVQVFSVPVGQRPPAGLCRVWFPDRHAGLQRPPTTCDVEVPDGAVLIRG